MTHIPLKIIPLADSIFRS